jgi:protein-tyrosine phosphatase
MRVLFVCLGNICRSPTAEGIFREQLKKAGLAHHVHTDSAGTGSWHIGHPPDRRAQAAAAQRGIDISDLRARQFSAEDLDRFDWVLAMDQDNLNKMLAAFTESEAQTEPQLISHFSQRHRGEEVPDPYYGGEDGFEQVLDMLEDCCAGLLREVQANLK